MFLSRRYETFAADLKALEAGRAARESGQRIGIGAYHRPEPAQRHCRNCPLRERCTTARGGRTLNLTIHDAELAEACRAWREGDFADDYRRWRPMVERSLAWLVRPGRRVAYRGVARNRIWLAHRAAAINLQRLITLGLNHQGGWIITT
jgi:hypothetical protein